MILARPSLKVPGWATAQVADWSIICSERRAYEDDAQEQANRRTAACYVFGAPDIACGSGNQSTEEHNRQVANIIDGGNERQLQFLKV